MTLMTFALAQWIAASYISGTLGRALLQGSEVSALVWLITITHLLLDNGIWRGWDYLRWSQVLIALLWLAAGWLCAPHSRLRAILIHAGFCFFPIALSVAISQQFSLPFYNLAPPILALWALGWFFGLHHLFGIAPLRRWLLPLAALLFATRLFVDIFMLPPVSAPIWIISFIVMALIFARQLTTDESINAKKQFIGFNVFALAIIWGIWQSLNVNLNLSLSLSLYPSLSFLPRGWALCLYLAPLLLAIAYAGAPVRKRILPTATPRDASGLIILLTIILVWLLLREPQRLGFLPIVNPLALSTLTFVALLLWQLPKSERILPLALLALWLNLEIVRSWAVLTDLPWQWLPLWQSFALQTVFSIIWSISAIAFMIWANQTNQRKIWMIGAALLAVVVLKLFFVELSHSNTIPRIISFIGVGVVLMLVGYFAPLPPMQEEDEA